MSETQRTWDAVVSLDLLDLSLQDRNSINEEIHGVRCVAPQETPDLLERGLREFETELEQLPNTKKSAYNACLQYCRSHPDAGNHHFAIHDPDLRLRFLRCELFDAAKAAHRFANYLNFTHQMWGDVALRRMIQFSDFNENEVKFWRKGYYQILPVRDRSGRRIITVLGEIAFNKDDSDVLERTQLEELIWFVVVFYIVQNKMIFYLLDSISRNDVETQKKGAIFIVDINAWRGVGAHSMIMSEMALKNTRGSLAAIPTRVVARHVFLPDWSVFRFLSVFMPLQALAKSQRPRLKLHLFSETDKLYARYQLKGYGIPIESFPLTEDDDIKTNQVAIWIRNRKYMEKDGELQNDFVECPGWNDVVFRKGKTMIEHPGNVMLRDLILSSLEQDEVWKAQMKSTDMKNHTSIENKVSTPGHGKQWFLNCFIVEEITANRKGRFLEWDKNMLMWKRIMDIGQVRARISILYCKYRKRREAELATTTLLSNASSANNDVLPVQKDKSQQLIHCFMPECLSGSG